MLHPILRIPNYSGAGTAILVEQAVQVMLFYVFLHAVGAGAGGVGVHALAPAVKEQELNQEQQAAYLLYGLVLWRNIRIQLHIK